MKERELKKIARYMKRQKIAPIPMYARYTNFEDGEGILFGANKLPEGNILIAKIVQGEEKTKLLRKFKYG